MDKHTPTFEACSRVFPSGQPEKETTEQLLQFAVVTELLWKWAVQGKLWKLRRLHRSYTFSKKNTPNVRSQKINCCIGISRLTLKLGQSQTYFFFWKTEKMW